MKTLPIRFFHAILSGLVLGSLLTGGWMQVSQNLAANPIDENAVGDSVDPAATPPVDGEPAADDPLNAADPDGDGIPSAWEAGYHHDPESATDAGTDFDNDGLTASEEYQLHTRTSGASGNPLGQWAVETVEGVIAADIAWMWPVDMNNRGELIVNASLIENNIWRDTAFLIDVNREWNEIQPTAGPDGGYLWANDLNDKGEVVGSRYSADWTEYGSYIWDKTAGFRPFKFNGLHAEAWKINNFGAWIGSTEDPNGGGMMPAFVVDGVNLHSPGDWWPYVSFSDLNDFGEAMGSFYSPGTGRNHTFLAHGDWRFDTGLLGGVPLFDQDTWSWSWSSAMNAYGEFAGGAGGQRDNRWTYLGFHFDGEFSEIKFAGRELDYLAPQSLNSSNTIVGYAQDRSGHWGGFVHKDQVGIFLDELLPQSGARYVSKVNDKGQMLAVSSNQDQIFVISPDQDQDGDGMADDWEDFHGLDKTFAGDANHDADTDGTNNFGEFLMRSNPNASPVLDPDGEEIDTRPGIDTDGDGLPNVWEWENGLNYEDRSDATLDFDRDGYTNLQEFRLHTDPRGAPSFRIREVGPFPGAASISLSSATLGDGLAGAEVAGHLGNNIAESVFFNARPALSTDGGQRPAHWSILRSNEAGTFSWVPSHGSQYTYPVLQSPGGAFLSQTYGNPNQFLYWSSPTATPVGLSGAAGAHDIGYLHNARFSPSGTYLVATRTPAGNSSTYQPILWKMPVSGSNTFTPIRLIPPTGSTINDWATFYVNDHGFVAATGSVAGQSRPILWKPNADGISMSASILPPLPGGTWTTVAGLSNDASPIVCGTSSTSGGRQRATVWSSAGPATDIGTLVGGNQSVATAVSRGGVVAGHSNVLVGNALKYQPFLATYDGNSSKWHLKGQGDPVSNVPSIQSVNDSGEILGRVVEYAPTYRQIPTLWRHGRAHPLHTLIPRGSGHTLDLVSALNPQGTLLATTWKDGARMTILLTPDRDTDGDGLPDAFENEHSFNAFTANNPASDADSDGLSDLDEYRNGTHPRNPDSDADGMNDGWEISWGLLPLDPTDAALDPDNDRVTNLRESQIGTTPTGIYKVETRVIDTDGVSPTFVAADDSGRLIHTGQYHYNYETDESGFQIESYQQDYHAQSLISSSGVESIALPSTTSHTRYNSDWSEYSYRYDSPTYWPDPVSGRIHGVMQRSTWTYDGYNYYGEDSVFLIPDAANSPHESSWIAWNTVEENLKLGDSPPLSSNESLSPWPISVSRSGTRRLHASSGSGSQMMLNHSGELVRILPHSFSWQLVNDLGQAVALTTRRIPAANGVPAYSTPELHLNSDGANITSHAITNDPGLSPGYSLRGFSEDGKVLLSRTERNYQMTYATRHYLFDIRTGTLQHIRQPGHGGESIVALSAESGRLLGSGNKPFQVTPEGTCVRLDALRIKNTASDTPIPVGSLYPGTFHSNHITTDGSITLATANTQNQTTILQTVPHNDMDADGMSDDWEVSEIQHLVENYPELWSHLANTGDLDPNTDYWNSGYNALQFYLRGFNFFNRELSPTLDSDKDSVPDSIDADPLDKVIDWKPADEAAYIAIELDHLDFKGRPTFESDLTASIGDNGTVLWGDPIRATGEDGKVDWCERSRIWINGRWSEDLRKSPTSFEGFELPSFYVPDKRHPSQILEFNHFVRPYDPLESWPGLNSNRPNAVCGNWVVGNASYQATKILPVIYVVGYDENGQEILEVRMDPISDHIESVNTLWTIPVEPEIDHSTAKPMAAPARPSVGNNTHNWRKESYSDEWQAVNYRTVASPGGALAVLGGERTYEHRKWLVWTPPSEPNGNTYTPGHGAATWEVPYGREDFRNLMLTAVEDGGVAVGRRDGGYPMWTRHLVAINNGIEEPLPKRNSGITDYLSEVNAICRVPVAETRDTRVVAGGSDLWVKKNGHWRVAQRTPSAAPIIAVAGNGVLLGSHAIWRNGSSIALDKLVENQTIHQNGVDVPRFTNLKAYTMNSRGAIVALADDKLDSGDGKKTLVYLIPLEITTNKRGTLNKPGAQVPPGTGEYGYETVMMENGDSESSVNSTSRDCEQDGSMSDFRKENDDDLVKVVLKFPANLRIPGASLKVLHEGMQVDATMSNPKLAIRAGGASRLKFYKEDGTFITNPATDLEIPDLGKPPADRYLSKILTDGEITLFIEGGDRFGELPANRFDRLGGARIKLEIKIDGTSADAKLLVYRGGFLRFLQPRGAPGRNGTFEFWDGKGRVRHQWKGYGKEFSKDETNMGIRLLSWRAKSGKTTGSAYNKVNKNGHIPPGWWRQYLSEKEWSSSQQDSFTESGATRKIKQGSYVRWRQDDEVNHSNRYTTRYMYDGSNPHDRSIGEPESIMFKYDMDPIAPSNTTADEAAQGRSAIQIHPDGQCDDPVMGGTAGCIGIQTYQDCQQVLRVLQSFNGLKVKVELQ